ncbi:hypothetical protein [Herbaspirillum autotrophicum]|uniref:hypothetical protein n=1 Tax=Herbaspirillum autotrophicum TaxID=180195 RepID=UPI000AE71295|nr:hypothetical protein [Herbaspirillum autotrophicum]
MRNLTESELDFVSGAITIPDFRHDGHDYTNVNVNENNGSMSIDGIPYSVEGSINSHGDTAITISINNQSFSGNVMQAGGGMLDFRLGTDGAGMCAPLPGNWTNWGNNDVSGSYCR